MAVGTKQNEFSWLVECFVNAGGVQLHHWMKRTVELEGPHCSHT
jgi:hypothetical protein